MSSQRRRRRIYWIEKKIQYPYLNNVIVLVIAVSLFFSYFALSARRDLGKNLAKIIEMHELSKGGVKIKLNLEPLEKEIQLAHTLMALGIIVPTALLALGLGYMSIRHSHKLAGPVYRFKVTLRTATEGDLSVWTRLRRKDQLKDVASELNRLLETVGTNYVKEK